MCRSPERSDSSFAAPREWHLVPLAALAISHPIADVLVRGPEFFVAHDFDRLRFLVLGFFLFAALPASFWLIASASARLHSRVGRWLMSSLLATLIALIAMQAFKQMGIREDYGVPSAAAAGVLGAALYGRLRWFRGFLAMLAPAPLVVALVFLSRLLSPG